MFAFLSFFLNNYVKRLSDEIVLHNKICCQEKEYWQSHLFKKKNKLYERMFTNANVILTKIKS